MSNSFFNQVFKTKNQQVFLSVLKEKNIELYIKREDGIHPFVSGNKFRKLKYNIQEAKNQQLTTLLTFGGAFSNHIVATAFAGKLSGFKTTGKRRSENSTLQVVSKKRQPNGYLFIFILRQV